LKWIKDLKVRPESLTILQERLGKTPKHVSIDNNFLNRIPIAQWIREMINNSLYPEQTFKK
jgi:hypothetical protein